MLRKYFHFYSTQRSKKILHIAIPSGLNSLLDIINISIDLFLIGIFGANAIVAVGVSLNYILLAFAFTTIIFVGNSALVSRFLGANNKNAANEVVVSLTFASLCLSIPLTTLAFLGFTPFFEWINISKQAQEIAYSYLSITLFSIPLLLIKQVSISAFSAAGATNIPFMIKIFITLLNPLIKYSFIFGFFLIPAFGVKGAAIATLIVNILETLALLFCLIFYKKSPLSLKGKINFNYIKRALIIGIPSGCERLFTLFAIILMTKFVALYGTYDLAGYQIATRIEGFAFMPGFGFMIASMVLMGQNLGAKKPLEARYSTLNALFLGGVFMGVIGIIMSIFAPLFSSFFSKDLKTIEASVRYLIPIGISQIAFAYICILDGALRGAGITKITLIVNGLMIWGIRVIPCYFIATLKYPIIIFIFVFVVRLFYVLLSIGKSFKAEFGNTIKFKGKRDL